MREKLAPRFCREDRGRGGGNIVTVLDLKKVFWFPDFGNGTNRSITVQGVSIVATLHRVFCWV